MTDKRFNIKFDGFKDNGEPMTATEVEKMLNHLHEENEQLKSKLKSAEKVLHNLGVKLVYSETYGKWLVE